MIANIFGLLEALLLDWLLSRHFRRMALLEKKESKPTQKEGGA